MYWERSDGMPRERTQLQSLGLGQQQQIAQLGIIERLGARRADNACVTKPTSYSTNIGEKAKQHMDDVNLMAGLCSHPRRVPGVGLLAKK